MFERLLKNLGLSETGGDTIPTDADGKVIRAQKLALYQTRWCGYCVRVRRVIEELGLDVELRDIDDDPQHRNDLVAARGRSTVPVLRMTFADGTERWMPESADIVAYLRHIAG